MASHKLNFTKAALERITPPTSPVAKSGGFYDSYHDTREKGLVLLVSNGGAKTYYLYTKIGGRPERVKLGAFTDLSIEQARKKAATHRGEIADGKNPQQAKRAFRQEATLKELFDEFLERYSKKHKKSWKYDEREINKFLSHWFTRKISSITTQEVQKLHERICEENGLYQANRLLERLRAMYNKAKEWGWEGDNPTSGIKKFKEKSRDRFIQPEELPHFFLALGDEDNTTARDYILLSLLTGARKSNVLSMRWEEVSFAREVWRIPETKNGESLEVTLSPEAMEILKERKREATNEWVFPGTGEQGYLQDPKKAWRRVLHRATIALWAENEKLTPLVESARKSITGDYSCHKHYQAIQALAKKKKINLSNGLMDLRLHDLRRTLGSWQAASGATTAIIGKSLGHKSQLATKVYERLNLDPVKQSVNTATAAMFAAGGWNNGKTKA